MTHNIHDKPIRRLSLLSYLCLMGLLVCLTPLLWIATASAEEITVTSYNPAKGQTDGSPCTGASSRNLCAAAEEGDRTIALSRDLLKLYKWHDKVRLTSDNPQCSGVYSVEDTMAKRHSNRADLFNLNRADNTSCRATLSKP